jgi:predicted small secreted protein
MWYFLETLSNKREANIEIQGSWITINKYFVKNIDNEKIKYLNKITAIPQSGITKKLLSELDYLGDVTGKCVPVFSKRFIEKMNEHLNNFVEFFPCTVILNENDYLFYIAQIKNKYAVIDLEKSGKRKLTDGSNILDLPVIIKNEIDEKLLIIRDAEYENHVIVSELFKKIVEENKLKVGFMETTHTFFK